MTGGEQDDDRWQRLLDEVGAAVEGESSRDLWDEVAERTRFERGQLTLADRLRAAAGTPVRFHMSDGTVREALPVDGRSGDGWQMVSHRDGSRGIVVLDHVEALAGLTRGSAPDRPTRAPDLRAAMASLARDRVWAQFHLSGGLRLAGYVAWVGKDYVEVVDPLPISGTRAAETRSAVTLSRIVWVSVAPGRDVEPA